VDSGRCLNWALSVILAWRAWVVKPGGLTGIRGRIFGLTSFYGGGAYFFVFKIIYNFI